MTRISDVGEAQAKLSKTAKFLQRHPNCVYCGGRAETIDHCPPRCFFAGKQGPEDYEVPACKSCNASARLDEQALSVIVGVEPHAKLSPERTLEWIKMLGGTANNSPHLLKEWRDVSRNVHRRVLRDRYGKTGDDMRRDGVEVLNIGPESRATIDRFAVKLAKALHYLHTGEILDGVVYLVHITEQEAEKDDGPLNAALKFCPALADPKRANRSLADQFIYRWGHSLELGIFQAVVRFSSQLMFRVVAMKRETAESIEAEQVARAGKRPVNGRFECYLEATSP